MVLRTTLRRLLTLRSAQFLKLHGSRPFLRRLCCTDSVLSHAVSVNGSVNISRALGTTVMHPGQLRSIHDVCEDFALTLAEELIPDPRMSVELFIAQVLGRSTVSEWFVLV